MNHRMWCTILLSVAFLLTARQGHTGAAGSAGGQTNGYGGSTGSSTGSGSGSGAAGAAGGQTNGYGGSTGSSTGSGSGSGAAGAAGGQTNGYGGGNGSTGSGGSNNSGSIGSGGFGGTTGTGSGSGAAGAAGGQTYGYGGGFGTTPSGSGAAGAAPDQAGSYGGGFGTSGSLPNSPELNSTADARAQDEAIAKALEEQSKYKASVLAGVPPANQANVLTASSLQLSEVYNKAYYNGLRQSYLNQGIDPKQLTYQALPVGPLQAYNQVKNLTNELDKKASHALDAAYVASPTAIIALPNEYSPTLLAKNLKLSPTAVAGSLFSPTIMMDKPTLAQALKGIGRGLLGDLGLAFAKPDIQGQGSLKGVKTNFGTIVATTDSLGQPYSNEQINTFMEHELVHSMTIGVAVITDNILANGTEADAEKAFGSEAWQDMQTIHAFIGDSIYGDVFTNSLAAEYGLPMSKVGVVLSNAEIVAYSAQQTVAPDTAAKMSNFVSQRTGLNQTQANEVVGEILNNSSVNEVLGAANRLSPKMSGILDKMN